jgi:hypothetical protein
VDSSEPVPYEAMLDSVDFMVEPESGRTVESVIWRLEGQRLVAWTDPSFSIYPDHSLADGQCVYGDVRVEVLFVVMLPEWRGYPSAELGERASWDAFVADVAEHELAHVALDLAVARVMETELRGMPCDLAAVRYQTLLLEADAWGCTLDERVEGRPSRVGYPGMVSDLLALVAERRIMALAPECALHMATAAERLGD